MKRMFGCVVIVLGLVVIQATAAEKKSPMDTNGDGKVSKEEFCAYQAKRAEKDGKPFKKETKRIVRCIKASQAHTQKCLIK